MAITMPFVFISCGDDKDEPMAPDNHEYVDLGLPSGTLWATCNIGADSPEEYGSYFAWGETTPKVVYNWSTYKWCKGSENSLTKYCIESNYGTVDSKTELDPDDDAAYVNWGSSWRMPTIEQQKELINNCTWTWTTQNGVNGCLVTGPNGKHIFFPASGSRWDESLEYASVWGRYWSRTLYFTQHSDYSDLGCGMGFDSMDVNWEGSARDSGHCVRAVRVSKK